MWINEFLDLNSLKSANPDFSQIDITQLYRLFESYKPQNGVVDAKDVAKQFEQANGSADFRRLIYQQSLRTSNTLFRTICESHTWVFQNTTFQN